MHIVATRPLSLDKRSVPAEALEGERLLPVSNFGLRHSSARPRQRSCSGNCTAEVLLCQCHAFQLATVRLKPAQSAAAERKLLTEQAERSGKPANIIDRMVAGRLHKVQSSQSPKSTTCKPIMPYCVLFCCN